MRQSLSLSPAQLAAGGTQRMNAKEERRLLPPPPYKWSHALVVLVKEWEKKRMSTPIMVHVLALLITQTDIHTHTHRRYHGQRKRVCSFQKVPMSLFLTSRVTSSLLSRASTSAQNVREYKNVDFTNVGNC